MTLTGGLRTTLRKTLLYKVIIAEKGMGNAQGAMRAQMRTYPRLGAGGEGQESIWLRGAGWGKVV